MTTRVNEPATSDTKRGSSLQIVLIIGVIVLLAAGGVLVRQLTRSQPTASPTPVGSASASPPPSAASPEQQASEKLLASFNHLQEAIVTAGLTSDPNNADIKKYAAGGLAQQITADMLTRQAQGIIGKGKPTWEAKVTAIDLVKRTASLENCLDNTTWELVNKTTGKSAEAPGQAKKFLVTATAQMYDDGTWRIETMKADRSRPC